MRPDWRQRLREWLCRRLGHREATDNQGGVYCRRCMRLLRGPVDRLYADLHGARERLCRAQVHVADHWRGDLQVALDAIDRVGSAQCPSQWSRFDQPEYGKPRP